MTLTYKESAMNLPLSLIILAAGQGSRMRSALPKVLHTIGAKPLLEHVVNASQPLQPDNTHIIYGHGGDVVPTRLAHLPVEWVQQVEQLGTGHAVQQALPEIPDEHLVLVLYGDVPLVQPATLQRLVAAAENATVAVLSVELDNPAGYGRIVRNHAGAVQAIVEHKDASHEQQQIREINTGLIAARAVDLKRWLAAIRNDNAQGEYYLTDIIALAVAEGGVVNAVLADSAAEVAGINDRVQLAAAERVLQQRYTDDLMRAGATLRDPARVDVRGHVTTGRDVLIDIDVVFEGDVTLGDNVHIGPHCVIRNARLAAGTHVAAFSHIDGAIVNENAMIGPYARLRPGTVLAAAAKVGNFVETKNTQIGPASKVNHLSYIGDAEIGANVNVGAGTITCNYDGVNKHKTVIKNDAFIGSGTQLVAPVTVGEKATIGAGSTISHDTPAEQLTLTRAKQITVARWQRPQKAET